MKSKKAALVAACIIVPVLLAGCVSTKQEPEVTSASILGSLDPDCIGCGPDAYTQEYAPHAMAYALLAGTGALLDDKGLSQEAADWLVQHSQLTDTSVGWGLGFSWDAFGDGSVNPISTSYGITTALAVRGLLDVYEKTEVELYRDTAVSALTSYLPSHTVTDDGVFFWYSDQEADAFNTFNVGAMLIGQYARAGKLTGNDEFTKIADLAAANLLANELTSDDVSYWHYSAVEAKPNDAVHAAYIVQGLIDYTEASDVAIDVGPAVAYLRSFLTTEGVMEFSPIHAYEPPGEEQVARLWGVGMLIHVLADSGDPSSAMTAAESLANYEGADGKLLNRPSAEGASEPRMTAHAALGLARIGN